MKFYSFKETFFKKGYLNYFSFIFIEMSKIELLLDSLNDLR